MAIFLGIDIGGTNTKIGLFSPHIVVPIFSTKSRIFFSESDKLGSPDKGGLKHVAKEKKFQPQIQV